jgi:hypothetical protein
MTMWILFTEEINNLKYCGQVTVLKTEANSKQKDVSYNLPKAYFESLIGPSRNSV